jgi:redox-sensitive bicupin YhaK (pirin superfamily)
MPQRRSVKKLVTAHQQREGGGFIVRRPIGGEVSHCDPFMLLDHLGPVTHKPGEAVGAPDHPHRGFETVTYIIDGSSQHKDSAGNSGVLKPGWVQWMTAGSGVVHSEMPSDERREKGGLSEGFQLWVNLPAKDKMIPPRYQDTPAESIPIVTAQDGKVWVKIIAGEALGTSAVIETRTPILYLDIRLQPGTVFVQQVPTNHEGFAYVWRGSGFIGDDRKPLSMGQVGILDQGDEVRIEAAANEEVRILLIAGVPLREPIARHGPFVMNTWEEIEQAFEDYQSGKLGEIEGAEARYAATEAAVKKQKESGTWNK